MVVSVAIVVARSGVLVEVAIGKARRARLPGDAAVVAAFGVVAGTEAVRIIRVEQAISVVVEGRPAPAEAAAAVVRARAGKEGAAAPGGAAHATTRSACPRPA